MTIPVRVLLRDEIHFSDGVLVAWTRVRLQIRCAWGTAEFRRENGHIIQQGGNHSTPQPRIAAADLLEVNEKIRALESRAVVPKAQPATKSAHVLVVWNAQGGIGIEGGGKIVPLMVQAGYDPQRIAEDLEAIIAWAEAQASRSNAAQARGRRAGLASATRRKTIRTNRRSS